MQVSTSTLKTPLLGSVSVAVSLSGSSESIQDLLQTHFDDLTRAERQLANVLLENYPVSGLTSITAVAQTADVSTPTVVRMVQKLGFEGFADFQETLRNELSARISDPIEKRDRWAAEVPDSHILNRFTDAVTTNLRQTLAQIDPATFDAAAALLSDKTSQCARRKSRQRVRLPRSGAGMIPCSNKMFFTVVRQILRPRSSIPSRIRV